MSKRRKMTSAKSTKKRIRYSKEDQQLFPLEEAKDSSKNILNILNNDCLQAILQKLDNVSDFYSAANVCVRFQQNAIECFPFRVIQIRCKSTKKPNTSYNDVLFFNAKSKKDANMKTFLQLFGLRIKIIHCCFKEQREGFESNIEYWERVEILDVISLHCRKSLNELILEGPKFFQWGNRIRSPFQSLKILTLIHFDMPEIDPKLIFPELKTLSVDNSLSEEWIRYRYTYCHFITKELLIIFQNRNPQLRSIEFNGPDVTRDNLFWIYYKHARGVEIVDHALINKRMQDEMYEWNESRRKSGKNKQNA